MARNDKKESFILYFTDSLAVDELDDEQAGILFKAILHFAKGEEVKNISDPVTRMAFKFISDHIKRDQQKYLAKCQKNADIAAAREAAKKAALEAQAAQKEK